MSSLNRSSVSSRVVPPAVAAIVVCCAWEVLPRVASIPQYVLPPLSAVIGCLVSDARLFLVGAQVTMSEAVLGIAIGGVCGFILGAVMGESQVASRIVEPYLVASNAVPVVAFAPLVVLWLGHGLLAKAVVSAFLSFFPITINTYRSMRRIDPTLRDLFCLLGATRSEVVMKYKLPASVPAIFSGLRLSVTFAVVGAIVAEFVGSDRGVGYLILQASYSLNAPRLYAGVIVAAALGLSAYGVVCILEWLVCRRRFRDG